MKSKITRKNRDLESIDGEARFSAEFSDLANYAVREGLGQS